jgi:FlaA1/EpsC-like NDP-sugar epimerase
VVSVLHEELMTRPSRVTGKGPSYNSVKGRTVMITGAGGSIGSELCKQVAASSPKAMILIDHSEYNLYEITEWVVRSEIPFPVKTLLADVRDETVMRHVVVRHHPDIVFHAAALKQVPLLERDHNLVEAVRTNVKGTKIITDLACSHGADLVLVSTDKAVNPSSCMGLTKRVAEIYVHGKALQHRNVRISQVRFGNVLGSNGSVVPKFKAQIAAGGPVTVTHPDMTRFLMTIGEAVGLTLASSSLPQNGYALYVLDMGEAVKIVDLARKLIELQGFRPDIDIPIQFTGVRPGEKLFEDLFYSWETLIPTVQDGVQQAVTSYDPEPRLRMIDELLVEAEARQHERVKEVLVGIVPEYTGDWNW